MAPAFVARIMLNLYECVCVCAFVCRTLSYVGYTFLVECCVVWGHFYKVMFDLCVCVRVPTLANTPNGPLVHATVGIVNTIQPERLLISFAEFQPKNLA